MALVFAIHALWVGPIDLVRSLTPRPDYWSLFWPPASSGTGFLTYIYQFVIGAIMGFSFLAAAPDAWKRVFIVTRLREPSLSRFLLFIGVGIMPFILVTPIALTFPPIPNGVLNTNLFYSTIPTNDFFTIVAATGLTACFLSSFDSAILSSVHIGLILRRDPRGGASIEIQRFHWLMVVVLFSTFLAFHILIKIENPYLLATFLLGPYATISAIQLATGARPAALPNHSVLWIMVIYLGIWIIYVFEKLGSTTLTTYQINVIPFGIIGGALTCGVCYAYMMIRGLRWLR